MSSTRTPRGADAPARLRRHGVRRGPLLAGVAVTIAALVAIALWQRDGEGDGERAGTVPEEADVTLGAAAPESSWQPSTSADGSAATPRHESGAVAVGGRLYLMGGRGQRPFEVYDPRARSWQNLGSLPGEVHHFQPVAIGSRIYVVGALNCCYPREPVERSVHVYDTTTSSWSVGGALPADRARGGAGALVRDGLIYVLGGNTLGHDGGSVPWFDVFDPASGEWRVLPDAPHARDHFGIALVGDELVAAGGRQSDLPDPFDKTVRATDVYDFASGSWRVGADIPTERAGAVVARIGDEVVVAGGEVSAHAGALDAVEAYDVASDSWRALPALRDGRHSGGGAVIGGTFHMVAGSLAKGGGPETASHETLTLPTGPFDDDGDGLEDDAERDVWLTDPARADTDEDELSDGVEVNEHGTDPLSFDSDADGLGDGEEVLRRATDPLAADSDADGLDDGIEVARHGTDPLVADSDADGTDDGEEIRLGRDPLVADAESESGTDGTDGTVDAGAAGGTAGGEAGEGTSAGTGAGTGDAANRADDGATGDTIGGTDGNDSSGGESGGIATGTDGGDDVTSPVPAPSGKSGGGVLWWLAGALGAILMTRSRRSSARSVDNSSPIA